MLKKCLIAIALTAFLAVTVQAAVEGIELECGKWGYKGHPYPWPVEYKKVEICRIPIWMEVGFYVEIDGCDDAEILLEQVECSEIGRKPENWPCYYGCAKISIRANFEAELDGDVSHSGWDMDHKERFNGAEPLIIPGDGAWHEVEACVQAYNVKLMGEHPAGTAEEIGYLSVRVKPKGTPP